MFFAAFDEVQRNQQSQFKTFSSKLTFGLKLFFYISLGFLLHNLITMNGFLFADMPSRTFSHNFELWRLFFAPFATLDGLYGLMSLIISFWWLISLFPGYEKKYSTIYLFVEVFLQNFLIQISYCMVVSIIVRNTYFYETYNDYFFSVGWIPIVIVWIFKFTGQNKEEKINFCFLPFMIKNKYLAWVISIVMILLTIQKTPLVIATLLGAVQFHFFQRSWIRPPLCLYIILQKPFLLCTRCFPSFIKTENVMQNLSLICSTNISFNQQAITQQNINLDRQVSDTFSTNQIGKQKNKNINGQIQMVNDSNFGEFKPEKQEKIDLNP